MLWLIRFSSIRFVVAVAALLLEPSNIAVAEAMRDVTVGKGEAHLSLLVSWIDTVVGARQDGQVLLHLRWPDLTGYHDGHERDYPADPLTYNNMIRVLLTLSDRINPLQERYQLHRTLYPTLTRQPPTMGLEHWGQNAPDKRDPERLNEVYVLLGAGGKVETYIDCYLPSMQPYPGCYAEFYLGRFLARVSYSRAFLPQWRAIQNGVRERLLSSVPIDSMSYY